MPVANPVPSINLEKHVFKENEALLYMPIYNKATKLYGSLTKKLAHITLRGDDNSRFHSYGYSKENSSFLYCTMKHQKKYHGFLLDENQNRAKLSKMFLYLPSTLDRKEKFSQFKDHVHLHTINASYHYLIEFNNA